MGARAVHQADGIGMSREECRSLIDDALEGALGGLAEKMQTECSKLTDGVYQDLQKECAEVAEETQRQCRSWVDGVLRKLEGLSVRTKEKLASLSDELRQGLASPARLLEEGLLPVHARLDKLEAERRPRGECVVQHVGVSRNGAPASEGCHQSVGVPASFEKPGHSDVLTESQLSEASSEIPPPRSIRSRRPSRGDVASVRTRSHGKLGKHGYPGTLDLSDSSAPSLSDAQCKTGC